MLIESRFPGGPAYSYCILISSIGFILEHGFLSIYYSSNVLHNVSNTSDLGEIEFQIVVNEVKIILHCENSPTMQDNLDFVHADLKFNII